MNTSIDVFKINICRLIYFVKSKIFQLIYNLAMKSFKENLRSELDFQGLTVKELSAKTGIIKGTLDNYLGMRASIPPADVAVKIAQALNVSVEYLVTGEESLRTRDTTKVVFKNTLQEDLNSIPKNLQIILKDLIHTTASTLRQS